jgi:hypothetical protein
VLWQKTAGPMLLYYGPILIEDYDQIYYGPFLRPTFLTAEVHACKLQPERASNQEIDSSAFVSLISKREKDF